MKKLILLALVALVAGAAFAATDPAFSGNFEYSSQWDFDNKEYAADDSNGSAAINLNGVVDEWSTVNAEFKADTGSPIELNQFTLTTDVTGALGADGPVGFTLTWGGITHKAAEYHKVAGYNEVAIAQETESYIGAKLIFDITEKVKVIAAVMPTTYFSAPWEDGNGNSLNMANVFGVEVQFLALAEGLNFNVFYTQDPQRIDDDDNFPPGVDDAFKLMGVTLGWVADMFDLGAAYKLNLLSADSLTDINVSSFGIAIRGKMMDAINFGLAFGVSDFSDFGGTSDLGINATWKAVPDVMDIFAAVKLPFKNFSDNIGVDAGAVFFLGATTYTLGYDWRNVEFYGPANTTDGGLYLKVKADF